jgi:hypothetical protein
VYLLLAVLLAVTLVPLLRWVARAEPAQVARTLRLLAVTFGAAGVLLLVLSGRLQALVLSLGALLPLLGRVAATWQRARAAAATARGNRSQVETRWLRMSLDHSTGAMDGEVLQGKFRGRALGSLGLEELLDLLAHCHHDRQSAALLQAYLDRVHGDAWRERAGADADGARAHASGKGKMSQEEAYEVLGLSPGAGVEQIREAHRRLIQRLHPDRGGSSYLAARINEARDVLLGA